MSQPKNPKPDISLAMKSGHFNLLRTIVGNLVDNPLSSSHNPTPKLRTHNPIDSVAAGLRVHNCVVSTVRDRKESRHAISSTAAPGPQ